MIQRLWRTFRLFFMILVFLALGAYLLATTPWQRWLGRGPDYAAIVKEGEPIVLAIRRYRARTNLWPEYLEDLVPAELAKAPPPEWYYTLAPAGPSLARATGEAHRYVGCDVAANPPQWRAFEDGRGEGRPLPAPALPAVQAPSARERLANELAELHRRVAREPLVLEHRRELVSLLLSIHREADAREALRQAARDFPDSFWPILATAALDQQPQRYENWARAHPSFTHWYYLGVLAQAAHDDPGTKTAILAALHEPPTLGPNDPDILPFYFFDMARTALNMNDAPLTLAVTDAWLKAAQQHTAEEWSCLPMHAAAELQLGNVPAARADLQTLDAKHAAIWAGNLQPLRKAIDAGDRQFHYNPSPSNSPPAPYAIFRPPS